MCLGCNNYFKYHCCYRVQINLTTISDFNDVAWEYIIFIIILDITDVADILLSAPPTPRQDIPLPPCQGYLVMGATPFTIQVPSTCQEEEEIVLIMTL